MILSAFSLPLKSLGFTYMITLFFLFVRKNIESRTLFFKEKEPVIKLMIKVIYLIYYRWIAVIKRILMEKNKS